MINATMSEALAVLIPALLLDLQGNLVYVNEPAEKLLLLSPGSGEGKHFNDLTGLPDNTEWGTFSGKLEKEGMACIEIPAAAGQWIAWTLQFLPAGNGYLLSGHNITANRQIENKQQEEGRFFREVLQHLPVGLQQFTPEGIHVDINNRQKAIWGARHSLFTRQGYNLLKDPVYQQNGLSQLFIDALIRKEPVKNEILLYYKEVTEGNVIRILPCYYEATVFPMMNRQETITDLFLILNEITDKKLAVISLEKSERLLDNIVENLPIGYIQFDHLGFIRRVNHAQRQFFKSPEEVSGLPYNITSDPFARRFHLDELFLQALQENKVLRVEKRIDFSLDDRWTNIDKEVNLDLTVFPLQDPVDKQQIVVALINDTTDKQREYEIRNEMQKDLHLANEQLSTLNKNLLSQNQQLEDFAHITSHNLRAPIANLKALMQMYKESVVQQEKDLYLGMLQEVIRKTDETLNDLVDVLQIRKDVRIERERISFEERLRHVKEVLLADIETSGMQITASFEEAATLEFPRVYLDSILQNLITNAIRYRSADRIPTMHFKSWIEEGHTMLTATDNGIGIDMARFGSKLFGFRKTFHKNKDARGIGLFITKTQVEAMGGTIKAESSPGRGTKFIITFKAE